MVQSSSLLSNNTSLYKLACIVHIEAIPTLKNSLRGSMDNRVQRTGLEMHIYGIECRFHQKYMHLSKTWTEQE